VTLVHRPGRLATVVLAGLALCAAACSPAPANVAPTGIIATTAPSPSPSPTPIAASTAAPAPTAWPASPSAATACLGSPRIALLWSDRFTDLQVSTGATADKLTFVFGDPSLPGPTVPPNGSLDAANPPYTQAGSGAKIVVTGDHVVQIKFTGMSLQSDAGEETYAGPAELKPAFPAFRHAVLYDASEGVVGWYVGYDGTGCITLARAGSNVTVTIDHS
jgi:hypothetical protein